jgi:hypothetical protein
MTLRLAAAFKGMPEDALARVNSALEALPITDSESRPAQGRSPDRVGKMHCNLLPKSAVPAAYHWERKYLIDGSGADPAVPWPR